ncbi:MAG: YtxH domain-containing protein [Candidatus Scalindua sp.]|nr:YtxH domain-containing protein [Candidatus Scalindua sp.]
MYGKNRDNEESKWEEYNPGIPDDRVKKGLKEISNKSSILSNLIKEWQSSNKKTSKQTYNDKLKIEKIRWRNPRFYKNADNDDSRELTPIVIEIQINETNNADNDSSSDTSPKHLPHYRAYYLVRYPKQANVSSEHQPVNSSIPPVRVYALNGTSSPIHEVNKKEGGIVLDHAEEYLDFFTTFVAGENGPFRIIQELDDISWVEWDENHEYFYSNLNERVKNDLKTDDDDRRGMTLKFGNLKESLSEIIEIRKGIQKPTIKNVTQLVCGNGSEQESEKPENSKNIKDLLGQANNTVSKPNDKDNGKKVKEDTKARYECYVVLIQYGWNFYSAFMKINQGGFVEMLYDKPLKSYTYPLPIGKWGFNDKLSLDFGLTLVLEEFAKEFVSDFLKEALVPPIPALSKVDYEPIKYDAEWLSRERYLAVRPRQYEGIFNYRGQTIFYPIVLEGVKFLDDVYLDDAIMEKSIKFIQCEFLGQVFLRNAAIGGDLIFYWCRFWGLPSTEDPSKVKFGYDKTIALFLDGISIDGELRIERSYVYGSIAMRSAQVCGRTHFNGTRLTPLYDENLVDDKNKILVSDRFKNHRYCVALDIRYSHFKGGLDLSAWFKSVLKRGEFKAGEDEDSRPTVVLGAVRGDSCQIRGPLFLSGLITTSLNPELFKTDSEVLFQDVTFDNARIEGGVVLWAQGDRPTEPFYHMRTFIGGNISFHLAKVTGNLDLRGIWVENDISCKLLESSGDIMLQNYLQVTMDYWTDAFQKCWHNKLNGKLWLNLPLVTLVESKQPGKTQVQFRFAQFGRTHVMGSVILNEARVRGKVYLNGAYIGGNARFEAGEYGAICCTPTISPSMAEKVRDYWCPDESCENLVSNDNDEKPEFANYIIRNKATIKRDSLLRENQEDTKILSKKQTPQGLLLQRTKASKLIIRDSVIKACIDLTGLWLDDKCEGTETNRKPNAFEIYGELRKWAKELWYKKKPFEDELLRLESEREQRITIENTNIKGSLLLFNQDYLREFADGIDVYSNNLEMYCYKKLLNKKKISREEIELFLQEQIDDWAETIWVNGDVRIENSIIDGEVNFSGMTASGTLSIRDIDTNSDVVCYSCTSEAPESERKHDLFAFARKIDFEMLRCGGDLKLTGLTTPGDVSGQNMLIKGHTELLRKPDDINKIDTSIVITLDSVSNWGVLLRLYRDISSFTKKEGFLRKKIKFCYLLYYFIFNYPIKDLFSPFKGIAAVWVEAKSICRLLIMILRYAEDLTKLRYDEALTNRRATSKTIDCEELREDIVTALNAFKDNLLLYKDEVVDKGINISPKVQEELNKCKDILDDSGKLKKSVDSLSNSEKENILMLNIAILKVLFPQNLKRNNIRRLFFVGGKLDFTGSKFSQLSIATNNANSEERVWILERADIQHLDIWIPKGEYNSKESIMPARIDFRGVNFTRITVDNDEHEHSSLEKILKQTEPFTMEPYASVEKLLRMQGRKGEANNIYISMQNRWLNKVYRRKKGPIRYYIYGLLFGWSTGFGIGTIRLFGFALLLLFTSFFLVSSQLSNWEDIKDEPIQHISIFQSLTKAIEISIPIVQIAGMQNYDDQRLRNQPPTKTGLSISQEIGNEKAILSWPISLPPSFVALLLSILGWIIWSFIVLSMTGYLKRE